MDPQILTLTIFIAGVALGAIGGFLLLKAKATALSATDLATLKERLEGKEGELQRLQAAFNSELAEHRNAREESMRLPSGNFVLSGYNFTIQNSENAAVPSAPVHRRKSRRLPLHTVDE